MTWYVYFSAWTFSSSLAHRQVKKALYPLTACINLGDMCLASTPRHYVWDTVMGGVRSTNTPVQLVPRTLRGVSALDKGKIAGLVNIGSILSTSLSKTEARQSEQAMISLLFQYQLGTKLACKNLDSSSWVSKIMTINGDPGTCSPLHLTSIL